MLSKHMEIHIKGREILIPLMMGRKTLRNKGSQPRNRAQILEDKDPFEILKENKGGLETLTLEENPERNKKEERENYM